MKTLSENGFPTPRPVDCNRHAILMSYLDAFTMSKVTSVKDPAKLYKDCMDLIKRFAQHGLIHSDFNEFNLMCDKDQNLFVIDFPQMVSTDHPDASFYYKRDVECIKTLFKRKLRYEENEEVDPLEEIEVVKHLDQEVHASGYYKYAKVKAREIRAMEKIIDEEKKKQIENEGEEVIYEDEEGEGEEEDEELEEKEEIVKEDVKGGLEEEDDEDEIENVENEKLVEEKDEDDEDAIENVEIEKGVEKKHEEDQEEEIVGENENKVEKENLDSDERPPIGNFEIETPETQDQFENQVDNGEMKYIKKALKKKFKKKKKFKTNKNKTKEVASLRKDILF